MNKVRHYSYQNRESIGWLWTSFQMQKTFCSLITFEFVLTVTSKINLAQWKFHWLKKNASYCRSEIQAILCLAFFLIGKFDIFFLWENDRDRRNLQGYLKLEMSKKIWEFQSEILFLSLSFSDFQSYEMSMHNIWYNVDNRHVTPVFAVV